MANHLVARSRQQQCLKQQKIKQTAEDKQRIDVINVYNVYKKNLCKRVYYFVNVYFSKNHMSETKQNYDSDEGN